MSKPYRVCQKCGAHLDAGERCDCEDRVEQEVAQSAADTAARPETSASPYSCRCLCPAHDRRTV